MGGGRRDLLEVQAAAPARTGVQERIVLDVLLRQERDVSKFSMDDYVDVAERIRQFYERFPEGSLKCGSSPTVVLVGDKPFIMYHAQAFRHPEDPNPADGWAWEPVPGPTQFTRDSELMNAETAAWGRAIVACGFETKKIASRQEMRNRSGAEPAPTGPRSTGEQASPGRESAPDNLTTVIERLAKLDPQTDWPVALDKTARDQYREPGGLAKLTQEQRDHLAGRMIEHADKLQLALAESAGEPRGAGTPSGDSSDAANGTTPDAASSPADTPFKAPTGPRGSKGKAAA